MNKLITISVLLSLMLFTSITSAAIVATDLGTVAPPATLGGYPMTAFPLDPQPLFSDVTSVASPLGGTVDFDSALNHRRVPLDGWSTWSHGYTGDVYYGPGLDEVNLTLPAGTVAFYLYAEPNPFELHMITATAQDGTSLSVIVDGLGGANGYGFHGTGGDTIVEIEVLTTDIEFGIGEFGINRVIPVDVDIKPGSCPNPLNPKSKGVVPVAIVGTPEFDPTTEVVPESITLQGVPVLKWEILDSTQPDDYDPADCYDCFNAEDYLNCDLDGDGVNDAYCGDGIPDLVLYFDTQDLVDAIGDATKGDCLGLTLEGETIDGIPIEGSDSMVILKNI